MKYYMVESQRPATYFYPEGGFRPFHNELRKRIQAAGVRIFNESTIFCLSDIKQPSHKNAGDTSTSKYAALTTTGSGWRAERLILNPVPRDMLKIQGSLGQRLARQTVLNSIQPIRAALYNAYWPSRWWDKYATRTGRNFLVITPSDSRCLMDSEFPGNPFLASVNASRPLYTDDPKCVAKWERLYKAGGTPAVEKAVMEALQSFFPRERIPRPILGAFYLPVNAWHHPTVNATERNVTVQRVEDWAAAPLQGTPGTTGDKHNIHGSGASKSSICLVGEAYYPLGSAWSWGALQSAMGCLRANYADIMSKTAKADMEFIRGGCQSNSSNAVSPEAATKIALKGEVQQPAGVELPHLNPATGKRLDH
ncbi:hypothetical protein COO60DRAFT_550175 [Scenedesmus sp. NREL 46B-D3]|nr:hypothetical protein COO60DRAFT_550175 [Scenedesmus sp. NREL 46B-D3]